jgi:hypothetical protein
MPIPRLVVAAYRALPGKEPVLLAEVRDHVPLLRSEGLATDRPTVVMHANDGAIVQVFEWASPAEMEEAKTNPRVRAMWNRFYACSEVSPLNTLFESGDLLAEFESVNLHLEPIVQPDPAHRAE